MKTNHPMTAVVLASVLLLAGCYPTVRVGALQHESRSVELGDNQPVRVEVNFGAGDLKVSGGAGKLLEAAFDYNVAELKPEVKYAGGVLAVRQPETSKLPDWRGISDFRNEWSLRLYDEAPMDLSIHAGAGTSDLQLSGLSLTRLDVALGAGISTLDLSGVRARDLDVTIDTGAADITVRLPRDLGVRVELDANASAVSISGLAQNGGVYTNAAYGASGVTLRIKMVAGIGRVRLEVEDAASGRAAP